MTGQSTAASITAPDGARTPWPAPPAEQLRLIRRGRPRKRWRYVALFNDELALCAALVQIGPARQSFWALHDRRTGELRGRTRLLPRAGELELEAAPAAGASGRLRVEDLGVHLDVELEEVAGVEALCPHGRAHVWTRKQAGVEAAGTISIDGGPPRELSARAVIDDTAGHHARRTEWRWSAGVGTASDGRALAWNLVSGVNDPESGSERAIWIDGQPSEPAPVAFAADLSSVRFAGGAELRFRAEAERSRHDRLLLVESEYRAPFGSFAGQLPGGIALARGAGVMEHHRARW
ncbi:MAG TPA: DUF2804 family protein [Solirubrobacteraceae bacterium]|nr:DUF2804 family protein [Solirubrobacteraceae bacterium]